MGSSTASCVREAPCLHTDLLDLESISQKNPEGASVHIWVPFGPALHTPSYRKLMSRVQDASTDGAEEGALILQEAPA